MTSPVTRTPEGAAIVRGDALRLPLGDETVDLICTSPPYFALRSYSDGGEHYEGQIGSEPTPTAFLEALWAVTAECWRVLKPSGSLFVNLGDKYAGSGGHNNAGLPGRSIPPPPGVEVAANGHGVRKSSRRQAPDRYNQASDGIRAKSLMGLPWRYAIGCIDGQADPDGKGWVLRSEIIWSKPNGLPESVTDRVRRSHEQWFHLTKNGRYWSDIDTVKIPAVTSNPLDPSYRENKSNARRKGVATPPGQSPPNLAAATPPGQSPPNLAAAARAATADTVLPPSVWSISTQPLVIPDWLDCDHFAAYPDEWPRRIISGWCPPGGVVLDPFGGTGTTAMVARALGRYGVSLDLSADYLRLARWRIWQSGQAAKVAARSDRDRQGVLL